MFNTPSARAQAALRGRLFILSQEMANQWPLLIERACRPDLLPHARQVLAALLAMQLATVKPILDDEETSLSEEV